MLSGLNTTGHEIGGSLGIAVLATIATGSLGGAAAPAAALASGIGDAFLVAGGLAAVASVLALAILPSAAQLPAEAPARTARLRPLTDAARPDPHRPAPTRRRAAQRRQHPRRRPRRAGERSRGQHGRDRSPGGRGAGDDLRPLPHPRGAASTPSPSARSPRSREAIEAAEPDARRRPRTRLSGSWPRRGATSGASTRSSRSTPASPTPTSTPCTSQSSPSWRRSSSAASATATFRSDVPAIWHLSMLLALVHAASSELSAGRMPRAAVEAALVRTVLGAITGARPDLTAVRPAEWPRSSAAESNHPPRPVRTFTH